MNKPMITAHSGCEDTEIDSMESVELALQYGADAIEIDVRMDAEGELRIAHHAVPQEEYRNKLTLRDIFDRIKGTGLSVNCDLKEQAVLYPTLETAKKMGISRERLILSGCTGLEQLIRDEALVQRGNFFLNLEEVLKIIYLRREAEISAEQFKLLMNDPWQILKKMGFQVQEDYIKETVSCYQMVNVGAANLPKWLLGEPVTAALQDAGIPLSVWTVNEPELVEKCLEANVLNITTRKVRQAISLRESYCG